MAFILWVDNNYDNPRGFYTKLNTQGQPGAIVKTPEVPQELFFSAVTWHNLSMAVHERPDGSAVFFIPVSNGDAVLYDTATNAWSVLDAGTPSSSPVSPLVRICVSDDGVFYWPMGGWDGSPAVRIATLAPPYTDVTYSAAELSMPDDGWMSPFAKDNGLVVLVYVNVYDGHGEWIGERTSCWDFPLNGAPTLRFDVGEYLDAYEGIATNDGRYIVTGDSVVDLTLGEVAAQFDNGGTLFGLSVDNSRAFLHVNGSGWEARTIPGGVRAALPALVEPGFPINLRLFADNAAINRFAIEGSSDVYLLDKQDLHYTMNPHTEQQLDGWYSYTVISQYPHKIVLAAPPLDQFWTSFRFAKEQ